MNEDYDTELQLRAQRDRELRQNQQRHQRTAELMSEMIRLRRQLQLLQDFETRLNRELRTQNISAAVFDEQMQQAQRQRIEITDEMQAIEEQQKEKFEPFVLERQPASVYHERELLTDALTLAERELATEVLTRQQQIEKYGKINRIIDSILAVMLREYSDVELQIKNLTDVERDTSRNKKARENAQRTRIAREAYLRDEWPQQRAQLQNKKATNAETIRRLLAFRASNAEPLIPIARRNRRGQRILFARSNLDIDEDFRQRPSEIPLANFDDDLYR